MNQGRVRRRAADCSATACHGARGSGLPRKGGGACTGPVYREENCPLTFSSLPTRWVNLKSRNGLRPRLKGSYRPGHTHRDFRAVLPRAKLGRNFVFRWNTETGILRETGCHTEQIEPSEKDSFHRRRVRYIAGPVLRLHSLGRGRARYPKSSVWHQPAHFVQLCILMAIATLFGVADPGLHGNGAAGRD